MKMTTLFSKFFWIFLVLNILAFALCAFELKDLHIQTDMLSLLPQTNNHQIQEKAFQRVSQQASQKILIFMADSSEENSYQAAQNFYHEIKTSFPSQDLTFQIKEKDKEAFLDFHFKHRYRLLSRDYRELLINQQGHKIEEKALKILYSPMSSNVSQYIKDDPFLLSYHFLLNSHFLQTGLAPNKGILMGQNGGKYYAFMALTLPSNQVFSPQALSQVMHTLNRAELLTKAKFKNTEVIVTGIPVHSFYASRRSMQEISLIGWISTIGIIILIFLAFRSIKPLIYSLLSIAIGFVFAFALTHWLFGQIHVLTLVFGTSLSGVSVDYACHYFAEYSNQNGDNQKTLKSIFPGVTMGLLTSILGYAALFFTPFRGLQEIAFFSLVGLIASFGAVILFFPRFYDAKPLTYEPILYKFSKKFLYFIQNKFTLQQALWTLTVLLLISAIGLSKIKADDDIRSLFSPNKDLLQKEQITREVLGHKTASQFFLVLGKTEQEVLERETLLCNKLDQLVQNKKLSSYQALVQSVPSLKTQKENYQLVAQNLMKPYLNELTSELGFSKVEVSKIKNDFEDDSQNKIELTNTFKNTIGKNLKMLWLGKINNTYASIVLLDEISSVKPFQELNKTLPCVYFLDKVGEISSILKKYRHTSFYLLFFVYGVMQILLLWRYGWQKTILITLTPILSGVFTYAIMGFAGHSINLFDVLASFLVLGIGIDYAIFYAEAKEETDATTLAVLLSAISTLLSFGLLAFSDFKMISSFGLSTFLGILFSYLLSPLVTLWKRPSGSIKKL